MLSHSERNKCVAVFISFLVAVMVPLIYYLPGNKHSENDSSFVLIHSIVVGIGLSYFGFELVRRTNRQS